MFPRYESPSCDPFDPPPTSFAPPLGCAFSLSRDGRLFGLPKITLPSKVKEYGATVREAKELGPAALAARRPEKPAADSRWVPTRKGVDGRATVKARWAPTDSRDPDLRRGAVETAAGAGRSRCGLLNDTYFLLAPQKKGYNGGRASGMPRYAQAISTGLFPLGRPLRRIRMGRGEPGG